MEVRKKILLLVNTLPIHGVGMMNNYLINSKFAKVFDVKVIPYVFSESQAELGKINIKKIKNVFAIFLKLLSTIFREKIDIAYRPIAPVGKAFIRDSIYLILLKMFGIPYVLHIHGRGIKSNYERSNIFIRWLYRAIFGNAAGVIVLGERLKKDVDFLVDEDRIYVVPNGIPDLPDGFNDNRLNDGTKRVLFLSNMKREKGPLILLETLPKVKNKIPNVKYTFVGGWSDDNCKEEFFKLIDKYNLSPYVGYKGRVSEIEKNRIFKNSMIFVFPTYLPHETFGLVNLEAMRAGLPVISTDIGAIPEMVVDGETGFIIPPKDSDALAEKIIYLLEHPDIAKKMGEAGRKRYEKYFTLEVFEKNMISVFNRILDVVK